MSWLEEKINVKQMKFNERNAIPERSLSFHWKISGSSPGFYEILEEILNERKLHKQDMIENTF